MSELATGDDTPAKRMRLTPRSVYMAPKVYFKEFEITAEKKEIYYMFSTWSISYKESIVDGEASLEIHLVSQGVYQFADKFELTVKILNSESNEEHIQCFVTDSQKEEQVFVVKMKQIEGYKMIVQNFQTVSTHLIWPEYIRHVFDDPGRPHDIVLNFADKKLYCNKVFLALWSNYCDRLFFSENADKNLDSYDIPDLKATSVERLLHLCMCIPVELDVAPLISMIDIHAIFYLEIWPLEKLFRSYDFEKYERRKSVNRYIEKEEADSFNNIIMCLKLCEEKGLKSLQEECTMVFHRHFLPEEKKKFFTEKADSLKQLKLKTLHFFMTEGKMISKDMTLALNDPVEEQNQTVNFERNIRKLADMALVCGKKVLRVHKDYLALFSPYFDRLFFGGFKESEKEKIELKEIDSEEFKVFVNILYPGRGIIIDEHNVLFLLKLADRFEVKVVMIICGNFLARSVKNTDNHFTLMDVLELADGYNLIEAQRACFHRIGSMNDDESRYFRRENRIRINQLSPLVLKNIIQAI